MKILRGHLKFPPLEYRVDVVHSGASDEKGKQHEVDHEYPLLFYSQFLQGKVKIKGFMVAHRFDSDLRLLGNGFRFTGVFSVVKNAGILKKTTPLAVRLRSGRQGALRLTWSCSHLQGGGTAPPGPKQAEKPP